MKAIKIEIIRFISNDQPGFVECKFIDAWNKEHMVEEKVPVVTEEDLDANNLYPQNGVIACELLKEWKDKIGNYIINNKS